jgi:hypothetical protein
MHFILFLLLQYCWRESLGSKVGLEGVRTGACMPQIIWVQVGPQAKIRDLKFFLWPIHRVAHPRQNLGHWPVMFQAHASIKSMECAPGI